MPMGIVMKTPHIVATAGTIAATIYNVSTLVSFGPGGTWAMLAISVVLPAALWWIAWQRRNSKAADAFMVASLLVAIGLMFVIDFFLAQ